MYIILYYPNNHHNNPAFEARGDGRDAPRAGRPRSAVTEAMGAKLLEYAAEYAPHGEGAAASPSSSPGCRRSWAGLLYTLYIYIYMYV